MPQIMTVRGPIDPDDLGFTSMHEHILCDCSVMVKRTEDKIPEYIPVEKTEKLTLENIGFHMTNHSLTLDNCSMEDVEVMTQEVMDFKESGGEAIVEMSTPGLRCNVPGLKLISEATDVHIIATTGLYTGDSWPDEFQGKSVDELTTYMLDEIENGIEDTGIKPGAIKVAVTELTTDEEHSLRAAARVSQETGFSIHIHPGFAIGNDGRRIAKILAEEGADLERVVIAHADGFFVSTDLKELITHPESWTLSTEYHEELFDQGVNLSIDCFGHNWSSEAGNTMIEKDWHRLGGLISLIKKGYSPQIHLGTDTFVKMLTRRGGGQGYSRLTRFVIPTLTDVGVSEFDIRQMTVENPKRMLAY
jgi:phosphotriesterase-related protein